MDEGALYPPLALLLNNKDKADIIVDMNCLVLIFVLFCLSFDSLASKTENGKISGRLGFPSDFLPPLKVCAVNTKSGKETCTLSKSDQRKFEIAVSPGTYKVYASLLEKHGKFDTGYKAFYSEYVKCGIKVSCKSHSPIEVNVLEGNEVGNVDPQDWYQ